MGSQPLPVEYVPLSLRHLVEGRVVAVDFRVQASSHEKTVSELFESVGHRPSREDAYRHLLPSEVWAMARALSASFGRLNELVLARTAWAIPSMADPGDPLTGRTTIARVHRRRLPMCTTHTETFGPDGKLLLRAEDDILLMHDCPKPFFVERSVVSAPVPRDVLYRDVHRVYCRYEWDPAIWVNNIHTDEYARQCGFERGLPEFPVYMDWIYHAAVQAGWIGDAPYSIALQRILPMYIGDTMDVVAYEERGRLQVRFLRGETDRLVATVAAGVEAPTRRRRARRASVA